MISLYQFIIIIGNSNGLRRMSKNTSIALGEHWQALIIGRFRTIKYGLVDLVRFAAFKTTEGERVYFSVRNLSSAAVSCRRIR